MSDTRRRLAKSAFWMVLLRLADRSIGVVSTVVLARLLAPADFGVVAMAMSIAAALEILSSFNFDLALIQNREATTSHYDTAWTLNVILGLTNAMLLIVLAAPVAAFYGEPQVEQIMWWLSLWAAVQGFANIGIVAFQRDLELHKEFQLGMIRKLAAFTVTMLVAYAWANYWALIAGTLVSAFMGVALSYRMHPYRPRLSLKATGSLFSFSSWLLINNVLFFCMHRGTDLILGRMAGARVLGIYNLSYEVSNLPTTELVFPISRALFPGLSQVASNLDDLRRTYLDVLAVILVFVVPAGVGISILAEPMVRVLLGDKWLEAIPLIQILALFGVLRASVSNTGSVYLALGKPRISTYMSLLYLALMGAGLLALVPTRGGEGAAIAVFVAVAIQVPVAFAVVMRMTQTRLREMLAAIWRPFVAAGAMAAVLIPFDATLLAAKPALLRLVALVPLGAAVYFIVLALLWWSSGRPTRGEGQLLPLLASVRAKVGALVANLPGVRRTP